MNQHERTYRLIGREGQRRLAKSTVIIFGLGGVGSFAAEALARSGVGHFILVDHDTIDTSNINRQLYALCSTIGMKKVDVAQQRMQDINPAVQIETHPVFLTATTLPDIDFSRATYILDAIDTVASKLLIIQKARQMNVPIISAMGAGNKLDATAFEVADIFSTSVCPLARTMRRRLRELGIEALDVVYSKEMPVQPDDEGKTKRSPGSIAHVPSVAGLVMAGYVTWQIVGDDINGSSRRKDTKA